MPTTLTHQTPGRLWWIVPLVIAAVAALVVQFQTGKVALPEALTPPAEVEPRADPNEPHEPVHIRLGVIVAIEADYLVLETQKLVGQGSERLTVNLTEATPIIEIQIPSFMNTTLRKELANGGNVTPRLAVAKDNLYVGQTVEIISVEDMYGYDEVTASRVEYKLIVPTEENL